MKKITLTTLLLLGMAILYFSTARFIMAKKQAPTAPQQVIVNCPSGVVGQPYSCQIQVIGGTPPFHYSIASGALPSGLTLDPNTGIISGVPTTPTGPYPPGGITITMT